MGVKTGRTLIISDGACPDHGMDKSRGQEWEARVLLLSNCSKNRSWASPGAATKRDARHSADRQRLRPRRVTAVITSSSFIMQQTKQHTPIKNGWHTALHVVMTAC